MTKFLDICFIEDEKNEEQFIEIGKKLNTDGLIFIYNKEKHIKEKNILNLKEKVNLDKKEGKKKDIITKKIFLNKDIYAFNDSNKKNKLIFIPENYKFENFNHVFVKSLKENNKTIGIKYDFLKKNYYDLSKYLLFLRLCEKYDVDLFIGSFAKSPYELKQKKLLYSLFNIIIRDNKYSKKSLYVLYNYFYSYLY